MESEYRKGYVYIQKIFAGTIAETEEGYEFSYNEDYLKREDAVSVSLTLPLQKEAYKATVLFPFFDGLIPEGWLLGVVSRNWMRLSMRDLQYQEFKKNYPCICPVTRMQDLQL